MLRIEVENFRRGGIDEEVQNSLLTELPMIAAQVLYDKDAPHEAAFAQLRVQTKMGELDRSPYVLVVTIWAREGLQRRVNDDAAAVIVERIREHLQGKRFADISVGVYVNLVPGAQAHSG